MIYGDKEKKTKEEKKEARLSRKFQRHGLDPDEADAAAKSSLSGGKQKKVRKATGIKSKRAKKPKRGYQGKRPVFTLNTIYGT